MAEDHIRYDILTQDALRGVVRKVLSEVAKTGLPGEHHFFISFSTRAPGVRISSRLLEQYDQEMTIVLQNQFWDLKTTETGFEIGLSFDGISETLLVPYSALKGFFDPSVQFGLQFEAAEATEKSSSGQQEEAADKAKHDMTAPSSGKKSKAGEKEPEPANTQQESDTEKTGEKVIMLDAFRKKP
ncbi:FIG01011804: hypothetical protein [hydrothermal vent metagenome]|uniref:Stringent starvation protein B n=1 Tax=hydrothermal vent metagenome TaxID=652676 RepID=A0A3B0UEU4_9ZZZZ